MYLFVFEVLVGEITHKPEGHHDGFRELVLQVGNVNVVFTLAERVEQRLQLLSVMMCVVCMLYACMCL